MSKRLIDKVALITGAASGQGAAETALFVKEGANRHQHQAPQSACRQPA